MTTTRTYVVTRYGANAANQHLCAALDVGFVDASNRKEAADRAREEFGQYCFNNQSLGVTAEGRVSADRWNQLVENLALEPL